MHSYCNTYILKLLFYYQQMHESRKSVQRLKNNIILYNVCRRFQFLFTLQVMFPALLWNSEDHEQRRYSWNVNCISNNKSQIQIQNPNNIHLVIILCFDVYWHVLNSTEFDQYTTGFTESQCSCFPEFHSNQ